MCKPANSGPKSIATPKLSFVLIFWARKKKGEQHVEWKEKGKRRNGNGKDMKGWSVSTKGTIPHN